MIELNNDNHIIVNAHNKNTSNHTHPAIHPTIKKISIVENNVSAVLKESNGNEQPITAFINRIKKFVFHHFLSAQSTDKELNRVLIQGRYLQQAANSVFQTTIEPFEPVESDSLHLDRSKGIWIGGMLISSIFIGGGVYCWQRVSTRPSSPTDSRGLSGLATNNLKRLNIFNAPRSPGLITEKHETFIPADRQRKSKRQGGLEETYSADLTVSRTKVGRRHPRSKRYLSCPDQQGNDTIIKLSTPYIYSSQQSEICLSPKIQQRCQDAHVRSRIGKNCFYVVPIMVLKLGKTPCLCPPPAGFEMQIKAPFPQPDKKTIASQKPTLIITELAPATQSIPLVDSPRLSYAIPEDIDQETRHQRISDSKAHIVLQYNNHNIPDQQTNITTNDEVIKSSLIDCYQARENMTLSKALRIISYVIENPITSVIEEGRIIINYSYLNQGCINNSVFIESLKKVEKFIDTLLSWIPEYNKIRFITTLTSSILDLISDTIDNNELSFEKIANINEQMISIAKDIVSSITSQQVDILDNDSSGTKMKKITAPLSLKNDRLMVKLPHHDKTTLTHRVNNHLYEPETKGYFFLDKNNLWTIDSDLVFNENVKNTIDKARAELSSSDDIYFFKNSSPHLYGDGILLRHQGKIYALVNDDLHWVREHHIIRDTYRYVTVDEERTFPIIHKGQKWFFEDNSSPATSEELHNFLQHNSKIKSRLINQLTRHSHVSPLTLAQMIQYDREYNQYIKIDNQYYNLKQSIDTSYSIESETDILLLSLEKKQYKVKRSRYEDICCFFKSPLTHIPIPQDASLSVTETVKKYYLDNALSEHINAQDFLSHASNTLSRGEVVSTIIDPSPDIPGGYRIAGKDYIYFQGNYINAYSNGDDTYVFGDKNDNTINLKVYKNAYSDIYFKLPYDYYDREVSIQRRSHCITKRQPSIICFKNFFLDSSIQSLLNINYNHEIEIISGLQPLPNYHNIFYNPSAITEMYYLAKENKFYHLRKAEIDVWSTIPVIFNIYGKKPDNSIDVNIIITGICIIKDFNTQRMIYSTPRGANNYVLNLDKQSSELILKWQDKKMGSLISINEITTKINENAHLLIDNKAIRVLFAHPGKKIITNVETAEIKLAISNQENIINQDYVEFKTLSSIEQSHEHSQERTILTISFNNVIDIIDNAISVLDYSQEKVDLYIRNTIGIVNPLVRKKFADSIKIKVLRMSMIFDKDNKDNIIVIKRKDTTLLPEEVLTSEGLDTLGLTINNDPLDRIYLNVAVIPDLHGNLRFTADGLSKINFHDYYNQMIDYYSNKFTDTMLHEAIHALGSAEDYIYLDTNKQGFIKAMSDSIKKIENVMTDVSLRDKSFEYLTHVYFMSNPIYQKLDMKSLYQPAMLKSIFIHDDFYRSVIILNNPDIISLIIRELVNYPHN